MIRGRASAAGEKCHRGHARLVAVEPFDIHLGVVRAFDLDAQCPPTLIIIVRGATHNQEGETLLHTLVQLGKALSLETLAEGIEQQQELNLLRNE
jgi:hypothetical protein